MRLGGLQRRSLACGGGLCLMFACGLAPTAPAQQVQSGREATAPLAAVPDGAIIARRLPRTVYAGGPFLRNPELTSVTFAGDEPGMVAHIEAFADFITRSSWWGEVTEGYCGSVGDCIGQGRAANRVRLRTKLSRVVSEADIELLLEREASQGLRPHLGPDALVLVYLPPGVTLRAASGRPYCRGKRAYHRMLHLEQISFAYAVMPRCGGAAELTSAASHEIVEAATNPDPGQRGFVIEPVSDNAGFTASGVEPVDPCGLIHRDRHRTQENGFVMQRSWSNRNARAGRDPCVPVRSHKPYLALVPRAAVLRLPHVGASATIELQAAADRPVAAWAVSALDLTGGQEGSGYVEVKLDRASVAAGDVAVLSVRVIKLHPKRSSVVGLVSTLGEHTHLWPILVSMR
jgi:hypothetical protein